MWALNPMFNSVSISILIHISGTTAKRKAMWITQNLWSFEPWSDIGLPYMHGRNETDAWQDKYVHLDIFDPHTYNIFSSEWSRRSLSSVGAGKVSQWQFAPGVGACSVWAARCHTACRSDRATAGDRTQLNMEQAASSSTGERWTASQSGMDRSVLQQLFWNILSVRIKKLGFFLKVLGQTFLSS